MRNWLVILIMVLITVTFCAGQDLPSFPIGQYWQFPDARSLSLGGAGSVSLAAPGAMLYNPAALTQIDRFFAADLSFSVRKMQERRSYPLYDRFDGIITQAIYALNNNFYYQPEGAVALRLPVSSLPGLTLALGSYREIDQNYEYLEEVRNNVFGDELLAYNRIKIKGGLQRYSGAVAADLPFLAGLSVGLQAGILDGSLDYNKQVDVLASGQQVILADNNRTLDNTPLVLSLGSIYQVNERIRVGADVALPYTVKYKAMLSQDIIGREEIQYPLRLNAGFEYRAQQILQARLELDAGYEFWSNTEYTSDIGGVVSPTEELSDVFYLRAGVEHVFYNKIPFRVGMQYRNAYQARGTTQTLLSAGTGFFGHGWQLDVAGALSRLSYRWPDLFDDAQILGVTIPVRSDLDTVDETTFWGMATLKVSIDR